MTEAYGVWKTIESAPRTGRPFMAAFAPWKKVPSITIAWSEHFKDWVIVGSETVLKIEPTHWRPLPPPPTTEGG